MPISGVDGQPHKFPSIAHWHLPSCMAMMQEKLVAKELQGIGLDLFQTLFSPLTYFQNFFLSINFPKT
jgi:hypothetical protein